MSLKNKDLNEWYTEKYEDKSEKERYENTLELMDQISEEAAEKWDFGMTALEVVGDLFKNHLIEETMDFIDKFKTNFPNLYNRH